MTEKVLQVFNSWVGYLEKKSNKDLESKTANAGNKNYTIFAVKYKDYTGKNYQCQAWCALFVSCCFAIAVGLDKAKELLCGSLYASCSAGMSAFKKKGQLHSSPKAYDIVFFLKNGVACHTGFVYKVSGGKIYTIEGNTSGASGVIPNGGGVCKKAHTINSNMAFGRPKYDTETTYNSKDWVKALQKAVGVTVDGVAGEKTHAACPVLRKGTKSTVVKLMQQRIGEEFNITVKGGYDGSFGAGTVSAVKAFQTAHKLEVDGVCGPHTWAALLKLK